MAQRILALAAEESPERLREALQSLGEREVRGGPAGWALGAGKIWGGGAPPGPVKGAEAPPGPVRPCQAGGGGFSSGEVQLTASPSLQLGDMVTRQALKGSETAALLRGIFKGGWSVGCSLRGGWGGGVSYRPAV